MGDVVVGRSRQAEFVFANVGGAARFLLLRAEDWPTTTPPADLSSLNASPFAAWPASFELAANQARHSCLSAISAGAYQTAAATDTWYPM